MNVCLRVSVMMSPRFLLFFFVGFGLINIRQRQSDEDGHAQEECLTGILRKIGMM